VLVVLNQGVGRPRRPVDGVPARPVVARALPLIADAGDVVFVGDQARAGGQRRALDRRPALADAEQRRDVLDHAGRTAVGGGRLAGVVGERGVHPHQPVLVVLNQGVGRPRRPVAHVPARPAVARALPLIADAGDVVFVGDQARAGGQRRALVPYPTLFRSEQRRDVLDHAGRTAVGGGRLAGVVGERGVHPHQPVLVVLNQGVGRP